MQNIISNELCQFYNWSGKSGWKGRMNPEKKSFSSLKLSQAVKRKFELHIYVGETGASCYTGKLLQPLLKLKQNILNGLI